MPGKPGTESRSTPPGWKVAVGRLTDLCLPSFSQTSGLETAALSRDPAVEPCYLADPLAHDRISARQLFGVMDAGKWVLEHAAELAVPVLLMHGSVDRLTSMAASCEFAVRAGSLCTLKIWDGCYHELHNNLEKDRVLEEVLAMARWTS
ncbi:MAG TPA: alpha/beta hydrolase [Anaerolineales bacterium]|nr:alpha/beta hydrolase [Anaerolineales bacterium]